jgi:hypothetical protein
MKMFNTEIINKNLKFLEIDGKCSRVEYNYSYFIEKFWSEAATTNELHLAFRTDAYFVVTHTDFLQHS